MADKKENIPWVTDRYESWVPGDPESHYRTGLESDPQGQADQGQATPHSQSQTVNHHPMSRRRITNTHPRGAFTVDLQDEMSPDDPEYLELLKIYDESDSETERENFLRERQRDRHGQNTPLFTQGAAYMIILCCVGFFILFVNYYNVKQLERLKQDYGLDDKQLEGEFWWKKSLIYRIYVQSFKDSDGDGIGDLKGIRQRIDHLHYVHADAILLNPIFESPMVDQGRDVTDFKSINPKLGTMEDFTQLVDELHQLNIRLILEFVPNHTSKFHKWFRLSRKGGANNSFKDYYIWHSGQRFMNGTMGPPSNWVSRYGGSAWTWDSERLQYYYHHYHETMPDLNHREVAVREEIATVFQFWLDRGVDGILMDGIHALFESEELTLDEPPVELEDVQPEPGQHDSLEHLYTEDQPEIHEYLGSWKDAIDERGLTHKKKLPFFVYVEDHDQSDVSRYYYTGADAPLSPTLTGLASDCGGVCVHDIVDSWITHVPSDNDVLWMLSSPDHGRGIRGRGAEFQSLYNMLVLLLPGSVVTYYGEEIGMDELPPRVSTDILSKNSPKQSRDPGRSPMQWNSQPHAGFTDGDRPWLPVHPNHATINVETQQSDTAGSSPLQLFQRLATLRKYPSFQRGKMQYSIINDNVFSFMRFAKDNAPYLIVLNFGPATAVEDFSFSAGVSHAKVVAHARGNKSSKMIVEGEKVSLLKLTLEPAEGVVLLLMLD